MGAPPNRYITQAMWDYWLAFDAYDSQHILTDDIVLGGIYANKKGYHNTVNANKANWPGNYSYEDYPAQDDVEPRDKARGIDLTFQDAHGGDYTTIIKYTKIMIEAGKRKDPRLYRFGRPILREILGTTDGKVTDQWDYNAGRKRYTPDDTHMWHIHKSVHTEFCDDPVAMAQILDIMINPLGGGQVGGGAELFCAQGDRDDPASNKYAVSYLQSQLDELGYRKADGMRMAIDGDYGPTTAAAVKWAVPAGATGAAHTWYTKNVIERKLREKDANEAAKAAVTSALATDAEVSNAIGKAISVHAATPHGGEVVPHTHTFSGTVSGTTS